MKNAALPKPIKSKNPVVILRHVIKAIKEEPKRYDQGTFIERKRGSTTRNENDFPACGTICCVAGWVNQITGATDVPYEHQSDRAQATLGLDFNETQLLFDGDAIPSRLAIGPKHHAEAGIKHIKRFVLKKWGKKL